MYSTTGLYLLHDPDTTLSAPEIEHWISVVSAAIDAYLGFSLASRDIVASYPGLGDSIVILRERPVNLVYAATPNRDLACTLRFERPATPLQIRVTPAIGVNGDMLAHISARMPGEEPYSASYSASEGTTISTAMSDLVDALDEDFGVSASVQHIPRPDQPAGTLLGSEVRPGYGSVDLLSWPPDPASWVREGSRVVRFDRLIENSASGAWLWYNAGYTLPSGMDYGTLPRDLVDLVNSAVRSLSQQVSTAGVKSETLGNASVTYTGAGSAEAAAAGWITTQRESLDRYARHDVWA
jgi:hypothetical protein